MALAALLTLSGCTHSNVMICAPWLRTGMTAGQVRRLCGAPSEILNGPGGNSINWFYDGGILGVAMGHNEFDSITFKDGKVIGWYDHQD